VLRKFLDRIVLGCGIFFLTTPFIYYFRTKHSFTVEGSNNPQVAQCLNKRFKKNLNLRSALDRCKKENYLESLSLTFVSPHKAAIHAVTRLTVGALFFGDKYYLIDRSGSIYREVSSMEQGVPVFYKFVTKPLTFDKLTHLYSGIKLDPILNFINVKKSFPITTHEFYFHPDRGISFFHNSIQIQIGLQDFDKRLRDMFKLLEQHKGSALSAIELDYKGKAFVRRL
jgi:hypothetical protein